MNRAAGRPYDRVTVAAAAASDCASRRVDVKKIRERPDVRSRIGGDERASVVYINTYRVGGF